jgi:NAD(P)-dependent dehydrogenase (short-subunit alcohol dehydrogenase family)
MPRPSESKIFNASFDPSYVPVAVFVGGTSGVGQGMVEAFARYVHGRAHIIIVGRNEYAAEEIIERLPKPAEGEAAGWKHEFIACDVSLMANVRAACAAIRTKVERLNFLVMTAGYFSFTDISITSEGLDLLLAMRCVSLLHSTSNLNLDLGTTSALSSYKSSFL